MKRIATSLGILALGTTAASAGGIDLSGQNIGVLFEKGRYAELSFGRISPDISGVDTSPTVGGKPGDVGNTLGMAGLAFKADVNDRLSYALIIDQPFGADIEYGAGSLNLGGTTAEAKATAVTTLLRWKFNENFSVHGGLRAQRADAHVALNGFAYGLISGYEVDLQPDWAGGYLIGAAYERPDIALRVALTYQSAIEHEFDTTESGPIVSLITGAASFDSITKVKTPSSVNLDFQTGIMENTLLFGQIRWAKWSEFKVDSEILVAATGEGLIALDDTVTYTLGVGRKFSDTWAGAFSVAFEEKDDHLVSPLAPTNGRIGATIAAIYTRDNMKITTGINYTKLGDAKPETGTPDSERADFRDNDAVSVGVKIGFTF